MFEFACPHCRRSIQAPDSKIGKIAKCPGCSKELTIPAPVSDEYYLQASVPKVDVIGDASKSEPAKPLEREPQPKAKKKQPESSSMSGLAGLLVVLVLIVVAVIGGPAAILPVLVLAGSLIPMIVLFSLLRHIRTNTYYTAELLEEIKDELKARR
jgi:hypothetical protein